MSAVRCKFRCLSITQHLERGLEVRLVPVLAKDKSCPEGSEENRLFWRCTPSGECVLIPSSEKTDGFTLGRSYYIDFEKSEKGSSAWKLWEVSQHDDNVAVKFALAWGGDRPLTRGTFEMQIDNENAWPHFLGQAGTHWRVSFTEAPFNGVEEPYAY